MRRDISSPPGTILKEVIPRYGIPISIGSDNRPAFVAKIVKQLAKELKITWNLHTVYWPQKAERISDTKNAKK
jgi:hypothetical protein